MSTMQGSLLLDVAGICSANSVASSDLARLSRLRDLIFTGRNGPSSGFRRRVAIQSRNCKSIELGDLCCPICVDFYLVPAWNVRSSFRRRPGERLYRPVGNPHILTRFIEETGHCSFNVDSLQFINGQKSWVSWKTVYAKRPCSHSSGSGNSADHRMEE